ncbi:hypothetical protein [Actinoplanes sp. CA-252034]|uniref:hypothetical protein n=1 Tax=Actinoplanes sp. CA-252034 TaxID=3239906 RepID=UPI003D970928
MTSLSVLDQLTLHAFVSDLPAPWLRRLASAGRPVYLPAGRRLFREDAVADRFWLLHAARLRLVELYACPGATS